MHSNLLQMNFIWASFNVWRHMSSCSLFQYLLHVMFFFPNKVINHKCVWSMNCGTKTKSHSRVPGHYKASNRISQKEVTTEIVTTYRADDCTSSSAALFYPESLWTHQTTWPHSTIQSSCSLMNWSLQSWSTEAPVDFIYSEGEKGTRPERGGDHMVVAP